MKTHSSYIVYWLWALILLTIASYLMPWIIGTASSLTFNAYDLAEWTSLHPAIRHAEPALLLTLALRLPLACLTLLIALLPLKYRLMQWTIIALLIVAQLPPIEFFLNASNDANYQQQATLALISLVGSALLLSNRLSKWHTPIYWIIAAISIIASIYGVFQTHNIMQGFDIPFSVGTGSIAYVVTIVLGIFLQHRATTQK